ncbi:MAG TPA: ABC transporter ATP-binding protein, partial [Candidatus Thermoplasmatota archaeon]
MATETGPVVEARDLVKDYGKLRALGPIDLKVPRGAVGLLGPNGAGKTTFIKTLLGLIPPTRGHAKVLDLDVKRDGMDIRQRVGYMPERDAQIINMTGFQYVAYCGELAGLPRRDAIQRSHEILNYVGLGEERYRPVETYSTGMRQRAKLAQSIVHDPRLVFLDEPTNGLDPRGRVEMLDLIRDLAYKRDISVMVSSHLLPDVEYVCRDVIVLKAGKVVSQGNIENLKKRDLTRYEIRVKGDPGA